MTKVAYPIGLKVTNVRMMTKDELFNEGWEMGYSGLPVVIEFEDGSKIYASSDPEGNDAGCIFGITKNGEEIIVTPLTDEMMEELASEIEKESRVMKKEPELCPLCKTSWIPNNEWPGAYPGALSRKDNKTEICSDCGVMEAVEESFIGDKYNW